MKMKLQDAIASKTLVDDMNASLQVRSILYTMALNYITVTAMIV